ncbi:hypothetical protein A4X09_0g7232, partial [Tilletia walkeri]
MSGWSENQPPRKRLRKCLTTSQSPGELSGTFQNVQEEEGGEQGEGTGDEYQEEEGAEEEEEEGEEEKEKEK